jgi:hypothetical protein
MHGTLEKPPHLIRKGSAFSGRSSFNPLTQSRRDAHNNLLGALLVFHVASMRIGCVHSQRTILKVNVYAGFCDTDRDKQTFAAAFR